MFMYLPFQNVHAPVQVPIEYEELYPNVESHTRRKHLGMVSVMDDMVGMVIRILRRMTLPTEVTKINERPISGAERA